MERIKAKRKLKSGHVHVLSPLSPLVYLCMSSKCLG